MAISLYAVRNQFAGHPISDLVSEGVLAWQRRAPESSYPVI